MSDIALHLQEIQDRVTMIALAVAGLKAAHAEDEVTYEDFDTVLRAISKLSDHVHGAAGSVESAGAEGGTK
jgi:hypothetical protein